MSNFENPASLFLAACMMHHVTLTCCICAEKAEAALPKLQWQPAALDMVLLPGLQLHCNTLGL